MKLHLHVKSIYFHQILRGEKDHEFRLDNAHWQKALVGREYDGIVIYNAYKPGASNRMEFPYTGWHREVLTHKHFGPEPVNVFAIRLKKP